MVTRPCDDTVATAVFDDCHVAAVVRSSVAPFDKVAIAVNCDCPVATKLDVPVTVTLETVGAAGVTGVDGGGVLVVGAVGLLLLEQLLPSNARTTATVSGILVMLSTLQGVFLRGPSRPQNHAAAQRTSLRVWRPSGTAAVAEIR